MRKLVTLLALSAVTALVGACRRPAGGAPAGGVVVVRVDEDGTTWLVTDPRAAVGAMGVFVFSVALRQWLREHRAVTRLEASSMRVHCVRGIVLGVPTRELQAQVSGRIAGRVRQCSAIDHLQTWAPRDTIPSRRQ